MSAALSSMEIEPPAEHRSGDLRADYGDGVLARLVDAIVGAGRRREALVRP